MFTSVRSLCWRVSSAGLSPQLETALKHQPTDCDTGGQSSPPVNLTSSRIAADAAFKSISSSDCISPE